MPGGFEEEGMFSRWKGHSMDYINVVIKIVDDNKIELTHTGLSNRIIEAMGIVGANPNTTPAESEVLEEGKLREPTESSFN